MKKAWRARLQPGTKPSRELDAYVGRYVHPAYGTATVALEKGKLLLAWSRLRLPLKHFHYDTFTGQLPDEPLPRSVLFTLGADGTPARLRFLEQDFKRVGGEPGALARILCVSSGGLRPRILCVSSGGSRPRILCVSSGGSRPRLAENRHGQRQPPTV